VGDVCADEELLRAEFEEHMRMQTAENASAGLSLIEARRQALLKFGSVEAIKESLSRPERTSLHRERSCRYAPCAPRAAKAPAFTAAVI
jgi:hypothetical protein